MSQVASSPAVHGCSERRSDCPAAVGGRQLPFEQVHVSFHRLLEAAGGEHEGGVGEHDEHTM